MNEIQFEILPANLLKNYLLQIPPSVSQSFDSLHDSELSADTFSFYTSVSAVFSSKIEGEDIELDSFIKHKKWDVKYLPDYTQKIDDLYEAYQFAQNTALNESSIKEVHILPKANRGKIRTSNMLFIPFVSFSGHINGTRLNNITTPYLSPSTKDLSAR